MMTEKPGLLTDSFFRTWRYMLFWTASLLSNIGTWMQQVAEPWLVLSLSNSPFWVGLDSFALNVPGLLFTLWGGVLADRYNRQKLVLYFQAIQFLCVVLLIVLLLGGWLKVWMIVCISFMVGFTDSLSNPAFQTIVPSLVNPQAIPRAVSLNSTQFNLSRLLGPAIAGVVIARFGAVACFSANAASYIPYFVSIYFIFPRKRVRVHREPAQARPIEQVREVRKLLLKPEVRLPVMTTLVNSIFCAPLVTFCPVLIKNVFHAQVGDFGWAMTAFGLGGLIGAGITFTRLPVAIRRNRFAALAAVLLGCSVIVIALNQWLYGLSILLVFAGAALTASNISINTFLQQNAAETFRGRVASLYQLALFGGISLGALCTGFVVSQLGIAVALLINGVLATVLQTLLLWLQHRIPDKG